MRSIEIYDTTLRDGSQGEGIIFSLHDKLNITERLDEIGVDFVEGGYPLSNKKDAEYFQKVRKLPLKHAQICAFGMTRRRGIAVEKDPGMEALLASEAPVITIVGKSWDFHVTKILQVTLEENIEMIYDSIAYLHAAGRKVIYDAEHFFDGYKANAEYAAKALQAAAAAGASTIALCDTNGGSLPEEIAEYTQAARAAVGNENEIKIGIHCHNDGDLAVANSLAAIDAGAAQVQGTINGLGERCGNADLISVISNLALKKKGYSLLKEGDLRHLTNLSRFVYESANRKWQDDQPFVGPSAFAHKGGMHVHAIARATESYEHIDPESVGNARRILVSELSGRSNIIALTTKHNIAHDKDLMDKILRQVIDMEAIGYQFEGAEGSFDLLVKRCAGTFKTHFHRLKYHTVITKEQESTLITEATVKLQVADVIRHEVAEGDGPVNALDAAIRKALHEVYPRLRKMRLTDYKVRVVNEEAGTAARIRVVIESADEEDVWTTVGVNENIIEASWIALNDAIEYKLNKDDLESTD